MTYLRKQELADMLRVSLRSVSNYINEGYIPQPTKLGKTLLWKKEEVESFLSNRAEKPVVIQEKNVLKVKRGRPRKVTLN